MLRRALSRLNRLLAVSGRPHIRTIARIFPLLKSRFNVERLETREVPAALTWTDATGNYDFYTAGNWNYTGTNTIAAAAPEAGDDVTFDGTVSSANCDDLGVLQLGTGGGGGVIMNDDPGSPTPGGSMSMSVGLNSLNLINGYEGTVDVVAPLTVSTFNLTAGTNGAIAQPSEPSGNDITVTSAFTWTGGALNSSTNLGNVNISGGTATIAPAAEGTVNLGSNINLSNGAIATLEGGTLNVTNSGTEFNINENSGMLVDCGEDNETVISASPGLSISSKIFINKGAWLEVRSGTFNNDQDGQVINSGGTLTLDAGTTAYFEGVATGYNQSDGFLVLWNGSTLKSDVVVQMTGGQLVTVGQPEVSGTATITCSSLVVDGGQVLLGRSPTDFTAHLPYAAGTLQVNGTVTWTRGTYQPYVSNVNGESDLWTATVNFNVGGNGKIPTLAPVAYDAENSVVPPTTGDRWFVLEGKAGINVNNNNAPNLDPTVWKLDPVGNPFVTQWFVIAK